MAVLCLRGPLVAGMELLILQYLNKMCGTHRTASGLLSEHAGRVLPLDKLAYSFFTSAIPERPEFIKQAQEYLTNLASSGNNKTTTTAEYYIRAMQRIADKGESWLTKEQAR
jgi:protein disulfide-isomerase A6